MRQRKMHKTSRIITIMAAMALSLGLTQLPAQAWAQDSDDDAHVIGNDSHRSQPGVVARETPNDGAAQADAPAETADSEAPAAGGGGNGVGVEGGVIFGESLDFEQNFGSDFSVKTTPKNLRITLDFRDAELSDVVKLMSAQTGRNFIIADSLRAGKKITIISPNPVTQNEAYQAFLSALQMNGLTVVQNGKFYKIVELNNAVKEPIPATYGEASIPNNDALVTHIATLDYVDVTQIKPVLEQLKTSNGVIVDYAASNSLIITDTGSSVNRMLKFIKKMDNDSSDGEKIWVYPVQYASVTDLEKLLTQVFQIQKSSRNNNNNAAKTADAASELRVSQVVADERTNKLIIVADERSYEKMKRLILKLDVEIPDSGKINVVHLQNSEAKEIYTALNQIISDMSSKSGNGRGSNNNQNNSQRTLQGEDISVVSSESTNDLIVVASPRDFLAIKNVIKELDRPRRQVFVEAIILEVSLERTRSLGIAMHGGNVFDTGSGDGYFAGRTELNSLSSISPAAMFIGSGSTPGFLMALAGPSLEVAGVSIPSLGAVINALQTNTDVNVLSTPTILTLDNQEAEISVGERIPYVTSTGSNYSSLLNGLSGGDSTTAALGSLLTGYGTSIERVDVALTLTIKPQINEGGTVRLDIDEEIEEVKPGGSDLGGPSTRRRNLKTVVVVPDQQTVVLGGLVRDSESQSVSKVPLLGDIPVLGYLFRSTETTIQKQNLLLLLTPYIIESSADLDKITKRKQAERDEFVAYFGRKDMNYTRSVDYDKKHGLLEEIRQSIDSKESELNAIREAQNIIEMTSEDEGIDLPDGFSDGYSSFGSGGGSGSGGSGNSAAPAPGPRGEGGSRPRGGFGGNRPNRGDGNR
ncbi:MAG: type II secretion system secretin GspD [Proteobacteria bacterium]|nr:type II secretion system secretin GspD [Pseudomonadota bacterium]